MLNLSFVGTGEQLLEYLNFAEWAEKDAESKGAKVDKIFSDLSGYTAN